MRLHEWAHAGGFQGYLTYNSDQQFAFWYPAPAWRERGVSQVYVPAAFVTGVETWTYGVGRRRVVRLITHDHADVWFAGHADNAAMRWLVEAFPG